MFTGLIEEIGSIAKIDSIPGGKRLRISAKLILDDTKIDDSICVNGVCLTVTKLEDEAFWVDAVGATLSKTTLAEVRLNQKVNLERAVRLSDRLGGHLVQGHVNGVGNISTVKKLGSNYLLEVFVPEELHKYIISEGSIALDGISFTIAEIKFPNVAISVIPHTWENTNLKHRYIGEKINIETDVIAKYVEKLLGGSGDAEDKYSDEWFKNLGY